MLKDNLIMLRNMHGFSQEELAGRIGISRQAYAKWESGATVPDIEKCLLLADIYGVTLDSLVKNERLEGIGAVPPGPKGKNLWGFVTMNDRGQIVIPKACRELFGFSGGQRLVVASDEGEGIALIPAEIFEAKVRTVLEWVSRKSDEE